MKHCELVVQLEIWPEHRIVSQAVDDPAYLTPNLSEQAKCK